MKIAGLLLGIAIAWALNRWAPGVVLSLPSMTGLAGAIGTIAGALTSTWIVALGRLAAFEKLDDLNGNQREIVVPKGSKIRDRVLISIAVNGVSLTASIVFIASLSGTAPIISGLHLGFWVFGCIGLWLGGFFQSLLCMRNIEKSRLAIVATQAAEKQRVAYLKKMREDESKSPVNRDDKHLKIYTEDYRGCGAT